MNNQETNEVSIDMQIMKFAIPAIFSGVMAALYNIIDQIFIGHIVGTAGNAATNVAFPLVTLTTAIMLLLGIGATANFSISLGRKEYENAKKFDGVVTLVTPIVGIIISMITLTFIGPIISLFGATESNYDLAVAYISITAIGFPFWMTTEAASKTVRADGAPKYAMICSVSGALLNCVLNPIMMIGFNLGIEGAAYATVISQLFSCILTVSYFFRFKNFDLKLKEMIPTKSILVRTCTLGSAQFANQMVMMLAQIVMNNIYVYYGALSQYGSDIPLACVGIITKINSIYMAVMIGLAQGAQPLLGFNFGAGNYGKIKEIYFACLKYACVISVAAFLAFQVFPRQILSVFGAKGDLFFEFGVSYFRTYMLMTFLNGIQPITFNFFTAIGKPIKSMTVSLSKQLIFLIPLVILLPRFFGITGVLYAGPIADIAAFSITLVFLRNEMKNLTTMEQKRVS